MILATLQCLDSAQKEKRETGHMYQIMIRTHTQNAHRSQCLFGPFQAAADSGRRAATSEAIKTVSNHHTLLKT